MLLTYATWKWPLAPVTDVEIWLYQMNTMQFTPAASSSIICYKVLNLKKNFKIFIQFYSEQLETLPYISPKRCLLRNQELLTKMVMSNKFNSLAQASFISE